MVKKNLWQFSITKTQDSEGYFLADVRRKTQYALFFPYSSIFLCGKRAQTEDSILSTHLFLYFEKVKNKKNLNTLMMRLLTYLEEMTTEWVLITFRLWNKMLMWFQRATILEASELTECR